MCSNALGFVIIFMLIFVHWKKGPETWIKIAPFLYVALVIVLYITLPICNLVSMIIAIASPNVDLRTNIFESWVIFYLVL